MGMRLVIILLLLLCSGCAQVSGVVEKGAEANDAAVNSAIGTLCRVASVGAIDRKFDTPERAQLRESLCELDVL